MELPKLIGGRIKIAREKAGLTAAQLLFRLGWNGKSRLSNYENGIRSVPIEAVLEIALALEPQLGKYVDFYLLNGIWIDEIKSEMAPTGMPVHKAIEAFKSVIGDAIDLGRIKLEPGLNTNKLVEEFSSEITSQSGSIQSPSGDAHLASGA